MRSFLQSSLTFLALPFLFSLNASESMARSRGPFASPTLQSMREFLFFWELRDLGFLKQVCYHKDGRAFYGNPDYPSSSFFPSDNKLHFSINREHETAIRKSLPIIRKNLTTGSPSTIVGVHFEAIERTIYFIQMNREAMMFDATAMRFLSKEKLLYFAPYILLTPARETKIICIAHNTPNPKNPYQGNDIDDFLAQV